MITGYERRYEECERREELAEQQRQTAALVPADDTMDKVMRYETWVERALFRALTQLERVQRRRLGEAVPAPVSVEFSARG